MQYALQHLVIIGAGASGVFTLAKIIDLKMDEDNFSPLKIMIIEKTAAYGCGLAYRLSHPSNILNTAAGLLSEMGSEQNFSLHNHSSFLKWVCENPEKWQEYYPELAPEKINQNSYLPRGLMGLYLRHLLIFYQEAGKRYNTDAQIVQDEVLSLQSLEENWIVQGKENPLILTRYVVLAIGGSLKNPFKQFANNENYLANPWPDLERLASFLKNKTVGVMGTKLSALDTLAIFQKHHYQGTVYLCSRSGRLPSIKNIHHDYQPKILTKTVLSALIADPARALRVQDFLNLLKAELEYTQQTSIAWDKIFTIPPFSLRKFTYQMRLVHSPKLSWQSILAALDVETIFAWKHLSSMEKHLFYRQFFSIWDHYRFSIPLETAKNIETLIRQKKLIICAQVTTPKFIQGQYRFEAWNCHSQNKEHFATDVLINATGIAYDVTTTAMPLLQNLLEKNIVHPHAFGGIEVDFATFAVKNAQHVFAIGDLTRGSHLLTNSYLICVKQASVVALQLYSACCKQPLSRFIVPEQLCANDANFSGQVGNV